MYVVPEQKLNRITNAYCYSVRPTCTKPNVACNSFTYTLLESVLSKGCLHKTLPV